MPDELTWRDGDVIGWTVVCWNARPGTFANDWDGEIHEHRSDALEQLRAASASGETCWLGEVRKVHSDG